MQTNRWGVLGVLSSNQINIVFFLFLFFSSMRNWTMFFLQKERHSLLHHRAPPTPEPQVEQDLFCVVTYHPCNTAILDILRDNWKIFECTPTLKCISETTTKIGFQHKLKLRDLLVHSRVSYPPRPTHHRWSTQTRQNLSKTVILHHFHHDLLY